MPVRCGSSEAGLEIDLTSSFACRRNFARQVHECGMSLSGRRTSDLLPGATDARRRSYLARCTTRRQRHGWSPQDGNDKIHGKLSIDQGCVAGSVYLTRSVRSLSHMQSRPSWTSSRSPRGEGTGYKPQVRQIQTHSRRRKSLSILLDHEDQTAAVRGRVNCYRIVMLNKYFGKFHTTASEDYESQLINLDRHVSHMEAASDGNNKTRGQRLCLQDAQ